MWRRGSPGLAPMSWPRLRTTTVSVMYLSIGAASTRRCIKTRMGILAEVSALTWTWCAARCRFQDLEPTRTLKSWRWTLEGATSSPSGKAAVLQCSQGQTETRTLKHQLPGKVRAFICYYLVTPGPGTYRTMSEFGYQESLLSPAHSKRWIKPLSWACRCEGIRNIIATGKTLYSIYILTDSCIWIMRDNARERSLYFIFSLIYLILIYLFIKSIRGFGVLGV